MRRKDWLLFGEMVVWIGVTLARAVNEPHAASADRSADEFKRRFPSEREDAA